MTPLQADTYRMKGRTGLSATLSLAIKSRTFRPILTLRLYQAMRRSGAGRLFSPLAAIAHRWMCHSAAMDLPLRTVIGPGLSIAHGWGIVVNTNARIGNNVTLFHGVTIGQGDRIAADGARETRYPVIEDDVWLGPGAVVVGGITVGAGSRIMANAVVSADVPPRSIVVGNPAIIARQDVPPDVTNRVVFPA